MRGRLAAVAVMVSLALPVGPGAAAPAAQNLLSTGQATGIQIQFRSDGTSIQRTVALPGLAGLPATPTAAQVRDAWIAQGRMAAEEDSAAASSGPVEQIVGSAPDLDADGRKDLIATAMDGQTVSHRGLAGTTGKLLWEYLLPGDFGWAEAARVGADGAPGLLTHTMSFEGGESEENPNFTTRYVVTALDARGFPAWTQVYEGRGTASPTGFVFQGLASPGGTGRMTDSPARDVLVTVLDGTETPVAASVHGQIQVLEGADGTTAATADVTTAGGWLSAGIVGDLSGDGLDDFVSTASQASESVMVAAHSANASTPLWQTTSTAGLVWGVGAAGDTDGDEISDIMLLGFDEEAFEGRFVVLSGADGAERWRGSGEYATGVRDINGDGLADIAVQGISDGRNGFGARYTAHSGADGERLYRRRYSAEFGDGGGMGMLGLFGGVGDADGDRRTDMAHEVQVISFDG